MFTMYLFSSTQSAPMSIQRILPGFRKTCLVEIMGICWHHKCQVKMDKLLSQCSFGEENLIKAIDKPALCDHSPFLKSPVCFNRRLRWETALFGLFRLCLSAAGFYCCPISIFKNKCALEFSVILAPCLKWARVSSLLRSRDFVRRGQPTFSPFPSTPQLTLSCQFDLFKYANDEVHSKIPNSNPHKGSFTL